MKHIGTAVFGSVLGIVSAEHLYYGVLELGFKASIATASTGASLLALTPFLLGGYPIYKIGKQINATYDFNSPLKLFSAHFLLFSSTIMLAHIFRLTILSAFVASINPFTLPIMAAAGVSAAILLGLYFLTRPAPVAALPMSEKPSIYGCLSFFQSCIPSKQPIPPSEEKAKGNAPTDRRGSQASGGLGSYVPVLEDPTETTGFAINA